MKSVQEKQWFFILYSNWNVKMIFQNIYENLKMILFF